MYASAIVEERLELAAQELGWVPEYHTVAEVELFADRLRNKYAQEYEAAQHTAQGSSFPSQVFQAYLNNTLNARGNPRLSKDEVRWMENERALVACDAKYFLTRYYWIKTPQRVQRFAFLPGQQTYFDVVSELESMRAAIEMIVCKARQHGISTLTEGLDLHRIAFGYGVNSVIASADQRMTLKMAQMIFLAYDLMDWWLKPVWTRRVESERGMLVFGGLQSGVSFQYGSQTSAIARGDTVKTYHLSEVASYSNAGELIEDGLFKCVHAHPDVFGVLESTAEGDTGWFYDSYWYAKSHWARRRSRLCPLFLPWMMGTDKYPTETWLRTRPVPQDWRPRDETSAMSAEAELYIQSSPVLAKVMGPRWKLPREQQWFWEVNFIEHREKSREKQWFQEMPHTDKVAFQGSYDNVFGREVIADVYTKRKRDYEVYGIIGQSIETKHEPRDEEIDWSKPRIPVSFKSPRGEVYRWELVPLLWEEQWTSLEDLAEDESWETKLFIWEHPQENYDYAMGVDTSSGIGSDNTVMAMARRARGPSEPDVQVAEFRSSYVSHVEAFGPALCIAAYYGRFMPNQATAHSQPYVSVEQVAAVGDTCQLQMAKMGHMRFHMMSRYDSKKIEKHKSRKRGWYTLSWSRPILTDGFVVFVQNGWYVVNSPWTIWEMDHWEVHLTQSRKEKFEHSADATDDGIFANAMATFCPNDLKMIAERTTKRALAGGDASGNPPIDMGVWEGFKVPGSARHGTLDSPRRDWELEELLR